MKKEKWFVGTYWNEYKVEGWNSKSEKECRERLTKSGDGVGLVNQKCWGALGIEILSFTKLWAALPIIIKDDKKNIEQF